MKSIESHFKEIQIQTYNVANPETTEALFMWNNVLGWELKFLDSEMRKMPIGTLQKWRVNMFHIMFEFNSKKRQENNVMLLYVVCWHIQLLLFLSSFAVHKFRQV